MNDYERQELQRLSDRIEQGGNDGADIWDYQQYVEMLEAKYGKPLKELQHGNYNRGPISKA